ncbi:MAG: hypothetical protein WAV20_06500, partial [Blastocatellia bacterium]
MKRVLTTAALCLTLALSLAAPASLASQNKNGAKKPAAKMSAHAEAVKACNTTYTAAVKAANDTHATTLKDAKGKKGKERSDSMKA